jgi:hypothetical protein
MSSSVIHHLARGRFNFLDPEPEEIQALLPGADDILPEPQRIFLEDEDAEPLFGFPIQIAPRLQALGEALAGYLQVEERAQLAVHTRAPFDSRQYAEGWDGYRSRLAKVLENVILASYGRDYPAVFWLHHSLAVSRLIREIPMRLRRLDLAHGRDHGDVVKYETFAKWVDRVDTLNREVIHRLASEMDESEESLRPAILETMRDNVLIFTEDDYVGPDLSELGSYFQGFLQVDGRDFRQRLARLGDWQRQLASTDTLLRSAIADLLRSHPDDARCNHLIREGFVSFLSRHPAYDPAKLFDRQQIEIWEKLLRTIKRFEILCALRKMVVPLQVEDGALVCRDRSLNTTWVGGPSILRVSASTRPMDFTSTWVVNPIVHRYGLVYDITDFSAILSRLGRAEKQQLEEAFRMTSSFQRRINGLATAHDLRLEKYLGDGAFYSGRNARHMLAVAIHLQRLYPEFVARGFPFDSGLRMALNYGEYRLLPLAGSGHEKSSRYEFFGHGLIELSRLSTGKKTEEIDDFKTYLIAQGYPEQVVNKFFAPMTARSSELVSKLDEARRFYAYINPNGALINEGIVASEAFVARLGEFSRLHVARAAGHRWIVLDLDEAEGKRLRIGIRKLGVGKFKGIEQLPVYEVIDGGSLASESLKEIAIREPLSALQRLFASRVTAQARQTAAPS